MLHLANYVLVLVGVRKPGVPWGPERGQPENILRLGKDLEFRSNEETGANAPLHSVMLVSP